MRPYTLGIDLHKRSSVWVLLDGEGNEIWKDSVPCHPDHIIKTLKWMPASGADIQAALEPTCGWRWVAALLEEAGVEVHPANANKVRLIAESTQKHDLGDARALASLLRLGYGTPRADVEAMLAKSRTLPPEEPPSPPAKLVTPKPPSPPASTAQVISELPKVAEMPKISEVPQASPPAPTESELKRLVGVSNPRDLGRGGAQHQAIQKRVKEGAEALGFRSVIERPVLDGKGSVDLWLERAEQVIACEISISTTIDHEVGNVQKCLRAGVPIVAVICIDEERLHKIDLAVSHSLGAEIAMKVMYFQPDAFISHLKKLPSALPKESETIRRGYKVKRVVAEISDDQQKEKEAAAIRAIANSMLKK